MSTEKKPCNFKELANPLKTHDNFFVAFFIKISDINTIEMETNMKQAEATSIISTFAMDHGSGLLEALQYMDEVREEGFDQWTEQFSLDERKAYYVVMEGMRELFFGSDR